MRWNDDLLAGFDLSQKSKVKEVKEKSKEKREKIPGADFIMILRLISKGYSVRNSSQFPSQVRLIKLKFENTWL